jgi:hypothetical protein
VLARGQFKIEVDKDDAIFIDRSAFGFQVVWNYMLADSVNLDSLSQADREIVREEADFYQVKSLLKLLTPPPQFNTEFYGNAVSFTNNNTVARVTESDDDESVESDDQATFSYVMSSIPFVIPEYADFAEKRIKLLASPGETAITFGLAPAKFLRDPLLSEDNWGYHCTAAFRLYGESVEAEDGVKFSDGRSVEQNSILQLRLHRDKSISILLDGEDLGVAFRDVNTAEPLYLLVVMFCEGDCVELLSELV